MAITRLSNSGIKTGGVLKYDGALAGYPGVMPAPTAADGGTGSTATVTFSTVSGATGYRAISTPGSFTGTGTTSPVTVSGLTTGTAYTFQIQAQNSVGYGGLSAASNSVTPITPVAFDSIASYTTTGSESSFTFSAIPSKYKHLQVRWSGATNDGPAAYLRLNGDTSSTNYSYNDFYFNTGGWAGFSGVSGQELGQVRGNTGILDIHDIQADKYKTVKMVCGDAGSLLMINAGVWIGSANPIISLTFWSGAAWGTSGIIYSLYGLDG